jgi:hypothetical protein
MAIDTTPFEDPRNAIGLLTEVLDVVLAQPQYQMFEVGAVNARLDMSHPRAASDLGHLFRRGPRNLFNGYRRRGTAELYQRFKKLHESMPVDDYTIRDTTRRTQAAAVWDVSRRITRIAMNVMENMTLWDTFNKEIVDAATSYSPKRTYPAPWTREWEATIRDAGKFGVDVATISKIECNWRFRDLTARSHRGLNTRAAFEAAWLAGQYDFAKRLITEPFQ